MSLDLKALRPFAVTEQQIEVIQALEKFGSQRKAAKKLGVSRSSVQSRLECVRRRASKYGVAPEVGFQGETCPQGFFLNKSTVHVKDGVQQQRWDRVELDKQAAYEAALAAIADACEGLSPRDYVPVLPSKYREKDLLTVYPVADFHLGMYAWEKETGGSWSVAEAKSCLISAFSSILEKSQNSEVGVLAQLGDFLHWDGLLAVTPANKHVLDADTRYDKLAGMALDVLCWVTDEMLKKHKDIYVIHAEGNHDEAGSIWLRQAMRKLYEKNPRVQVDTSPLPYYSYRHGDVFLGFHHGHKVKDARVREVFCADPRFRSDWGKSKIAYIHTGHLHSQSVIEQAGAIVERHPTLSARDAYSSRGGWVQHRAMHAITYHKKRGEVSRLTEVPR